MTLWWPVYSDVMRKKSLLIFTVNISIQTRIHEQSLFTFKIACNVLAYGHMKIKHKCSLFTGVELYIYAGTS